MSSRLRRYALGALAVAVAYLLGFASGYVVGMDVERRDWVERP